MLLAGASIGIPTLADRTPVVFKNTTAFIIRAIGTNGHMCKRHLLLQLFSLLLKSLLLRQNAKLLVIHQIAHQVDLLLSRSDSTAVVHLITVLAHLVVAAVCRIEHLLDFGGRVSVLLCHQGTRLQVCPREIVVILVDIVLHGAACDQVRRIPQSNVACATRDRLRLNPLKL